MGRCEPRSAESRRNDYSSLSISKTESHGDSAGSNKQLHFGKVLLLSLCLFVVGIIVDETIRWTNVLHGFFNGLFHAMVYAFIWIWTALPWGLLVYAFYRWRGWGRFRTQLVLLPSFLMLLGHLGDLAFYPPTAKRRFRALAGAELPTGARDLHCFFSGGGIADYEDRYYFKCLPEDVKRLVREMKLEKDQTHNQTGSHLFGWRSQDWPDATKWAGASLYHRSVDGWSYYLLASHDQTEVYIMIFCI